MDKSKGRKGVPWPHAGCTQKVSTMVPPELKWLDWPHWISQWMSGCLGTFWTGVQHLGQMYSTWRCNSSSTANAEVYPLAV